MDYRCPACREDLAKRRPQLRGGQHRLCIACGARLDMNVHASEIKFALIAFLAFLLLVCLSFWMKSTLLLVLAGLGALASVLALSAMRRTYLAGWPRYVIAESMRRPPPGQERTPLAKIREKFMQIEDAHWKHAATLSDKQVATRGKFALWALILLALLPLIFALWVANSGNAG